MTSKEFDKLDDATRKEIGKKYGFRRSGYLSYKIVDGYFFALNHLVASEAYLEVKPMYADDLWWDIFNCPKNKKAPKSLRGNGAFAVSATQIASYPAFEESWKKYPDEMIVSKWQTIWQNIFTLVEKDIESFISANPNPDKYFPKPFYANGVANLLYILALLHNNAFEEATDMINNDLAKGHSPGMSSYDGTRLINGYEFILDWINKAEK